MVLLKKSENPYDEDHLRWCKTMVALDSLRKEIKRAGGIRKLEKEARREADELLKKFAETLRRNRL